MYRNFSYLFDSFNLSHNFGFLVFYFLQKQIVLSSQLIQRFQIFFVPEFQPSYGILRSKKLIVQIVKFRRVLLMLRAELLLQCIGKFRVEALNGICLNGLLVMSGLFLVAVAFDLEADTVGAFLHDCYNSYQFLKKLTSNVISKSIQPPSNTNHLFIKNFFL